MNYLNTGLSIHYFLEVLYTSRVYALYRVDSTHTNFEDVGREPNLLQDIMSPGFSDFLPIIHLVFGSDMIEIRYLSKGCFIVNF